MVINFTLTEKENKSKTLMIINTNMQPRIKQLTQKKLIGIKLSMSLANNKTSELWRLFMSRRKEIQNHLSSDLFSIRVYTHPSDLINFSKEHEKWAAVEVSDFNSIPLGMNTFILESGSYAVFDYKGSSTDSHIYQYIYGTWLPASIYELDSKPHFEILGEKYKNNDPDSEEEIWIPIKLKA